MLVGPDILTQPVVLAGKVVAVIAVTRARRMRTRFLLSEIRLPLSLAELTAQIRFVTRLNAETMKLKIQPE